MIVETWEHANFKAMAWWGKFSENDKRLFVNIFALTDLMWFTIHVLASSVWFVCNAVYPLSICPCSPWSLFSSISLQPFPLLSSFILHFSFLSLFTLLSVSLPSFWLSLLFYSFLSLFFLYVIQPPIHHQLFLSNSHILHLSPSRYFIVYCSPETQTFAPLLFFVQM